MGFIGVRLNTALDTALREQAKKENVSLSDHVRTILLTHLKDAIGETPISHHEWKILAYNLLGVNENQIRYALSTSHNVHQFFSLLSKWIKKYNIFIEPNTISFIFDDKNKAPKIFAIPIMPGTKIEKVSSILERLEDKIKEGYYEGENLRESDIIHVDTEPI